MVYLPHDKEPAAFKEKPCEEWPHEVVGRDAIHGHAGDGLHDEQYENSEVGDGGQAVVPYVVNGFGRQEQDIDFGGVENTAPLPFREGEVVVPASE